MCHSAILQGKKTEAHSHEKERQGSALCKVIRYLVQPILVAVLLLGITHTHYTQPNCQFKTRVNIKTTFTERVNENNPNAKGRLNSNKQTKKEN